MIKVKDISGRVLEGVYRNPDGTLVINDQDELNRVKQQLEDKTRLMKVESELSEIKDLLKQLLSK